jgi:YD repeat-containing protein
MEVVRWESFG